MKKEIAFIFFCIIILTACSKTQYDNIGANNYPLFFKLTKNGNRLPDTILDNLKMYYYQNGTKTYLTDLNRCINEGGLNARDLGIVATDLIGIRSGDDNIKDYYLEYPNGTKDTIYAEYKHVSSEEGALDRCFCHYPLKNLKYNKVKPILDSTITLTDVYIFPK